MVGECRAENNVEQAVVRKHNEPRPRVAHRGIARFLGIGQKCNQVIPWSLHTFSESFMQIGLALFCNKETNKQTNKQTNKHLNKDTKKSIENNTTSPDVSMS